MMKKFKLLLLFAICIFIIYSDNEYAEYIMVIVVILLLILNIIKLSRAKDAWLKSEETFQKNYNFLRILLDTIPNPIFSKNTEGQYMYCNTAFEQYVGLSKKHIINKTVDEVNQGKVSEIYNSSDIELMRNRGKQTYESKVRYADGEEHDVVFSKAVLLSKEDEVQGIVGIMLDITERKLFEKKVSKLL